MGDTQNSYAYDGNRVRKWNVTTTNYGKVRAKPPVGWLGHLSHVASVELLSSHEGLQGHWRTDRGSGLLSCMASLPWVVHPGNVAVDAGEGRWVDFLVS